MSPRDTFLRHWPIYLTEAAGLFVFMSCAGALTTVFMYPDSPVHEALGSKPLSRIGLGLAMGLVTAAILYVPPSQRSGAHINPAVTWTFWRLGKIGKADAVFYTLAQFAGAMVAPPLLLLLIGEPFGHPEVKHGATLPGPAGPLVAFAAEFAISLVLMLAILLATNSGRLKPYAGAIVAALIALYIAVESPLSGMSLNPARSFGSHFAAGGWEHYWLYVLAPMAAMPLAAEIYLWLRRRGTVAAEGADGPRRCLSCDYRDGPDYPTPMPA